MSHYDALDLDKTASPEAIRDAYRRKAQKAHPDKGGSSEKFHAVIKAYEVLSNQERRERYDATGDDRNPADSLRADAMNEVAKLILEAIERLDIERSDLIAHALGAIGEGEIELANMVRKAQWSIARKERALKRFVKRGRGEDFIGAVLRSEITKGREQLKAADRDRQRLSIAREILAEYSYQFDPLAGRIQVTFTTGGLR